MEEYIFVSSNFKLYDLKTEFLAIKAKYLLEPLTMVTIKNLREEFEILFKSYNLEEFQYTLFHNKVSNIIEFKPIREIDKWVLKGILGENNIDNI